MSDEAKSFDELLDALTERRRAFVLEYLIDLNGAQAAIRAGFSPKSARNEAARLLADVNVSAAVALAMEERAKRTEITADKVLREFWAIATADPGELVQYRRVCCRHCWGKAFRYQETQGEQDSRRAQWERDKAAAQGKPISASFTEFDELGGVGFDPWLDPNSDCPECVGQGEERTYVADTRDLSEAARKLYAGVKITKEGLEVKLHDKVQALTQVGRHLGMFTDKFEGDVLVKVKGGGISGLLAAVTDGADDESAAEADAD